MKYAEWQKSSGLRVLRRVLDRQKILETTDGMADRSQVLVYIIDRSQVQVYIIDWQIPGTSVHH